MDKRTDAIEKVAKEIRAYFTLNGITLSDAAGRIGKSPQSLGGCISRGIGKNIARALSDEFGFSQTFLLTGEGKLFPDEGGTICTSADLDELHRLRIQVDGLMDTNQKLTDIIYNLSLQKGDTALNTDYLGRSGADREPRNR